MDKIYFVMPAYNEAENIEEVIKQWYPVVEQCGPDSRLVIANDGSKDDTFSKMQTLQKFFPQFIPLDKANSGHGATLLYLYRYSIAHDADFIFQTDSDGQTNPEEFWQFHNNRHIYDFQIGYRKERQDGASRVFVTKTLRLVVWMMFHEWVIDANTPFRLMNTLRLKEIMKVIPENFFLSNVAISAIAVKWKERIQFYKITFKPRQGGINSINMKRIIKIGFKAIGDFRMINNNLKKYKK